MIFTRTLVLILLEIPFPLQKEELIKSDFTLVRQLFMVTESLSTFGSLT